MPASPSPNARSTGKEIGGSPRHLTDIVLGVVRDGQAVARRRPPRSTPWRPATGCCTSAAPKPSAELDAVRPAQRSAAVAGRRRPRRRAAHRHRRGGRRLARRRGAAGGLAQPGADLAAAGWCWAEPPRSATSPPEHAVFLGRMPDGRHVWAVRAALEAPEDPGADTEVLDLRRAGEIFDDVSAQLVATATALLNWHDSARFSAARRLADQAGQGRLVAGQPAHRPRGVPPHRPRGDLPGARRPRPRGAGPPDGVAASGCSRCWPDSSRPASRSRRAWCARSPRRSV